MALRWSTRVCGAKINNASLLPIVSFFFWNFRPPALLEITGSGRQFCVRFALLCVRTDFQDSFAHVPMGLFEYLIWLVDELGWGSLMFFHIKVAKPITLAEPFCGGGGVEMINACCACNCTQHMILIAGGFRRNTNWSPSMKPVCDATKCFIPSGVETLPVQKKDGAEIE